MAPSGPVTNEGAGRIEWVVFDLGGVVLQPTAALPVLAEMIGADQDAFTRSYSPPRLEYDRSSDAGTYWRAVAGGAGAPAPSDELIAELVAVDNDGWDRADPDMAALIQKLGAVNRISLAVLSNAPASMRAQVRAAPWSAPIRTLVFSGEEGLVKPDPRIYRRLLDRLDTTSSQVVFIDDLAQNIEGARSEGLTAILHTDPRRTRRELAGLGLPV